LIVKVFGDQAPHFVVLVAYGTSQKTVHLRSGEFLIADREAAAYQLAGLSYSTKFSFHNTVELPYSSEWFKVSPGASNGQTPKRCASSKFDAACTCRMGSGSSKLTASPSKRKGLPTVFSYILALKNAFHRHHADGFFCLSIMSSSIFLHERLEFE